MQRGNYGNEKEHIIKIQAETGLNGRTLKGTYMFRIGGKKRLKSSKKHF